MAEIKPVRLSRQVTYVDSLGKEHEIEEYMIDTPTLIPGARLTVGVPVEIRIDGHRWAEFDDKPIVGDPIEAAKKWIDAKAES